jgi:3-oxoacyl-[acyl-carrier protein] reductase
MGHHGRVKGRHFLREAISTFSSEPVHPLPQGPHGDFQKACDLVLRELASAANRREAGLEKDFVRMKKLAQKEFGKINILVANAGTIGKELPVKDLPVVEWDHLISVDLRGVFLAAKYFIPLIETNPVGKIITITSELSKKGRANYAHYCAAKGGINGLTRSLALELVPDILVNAIAPGPIETDMILADMEPEWVEKEKDIPMQRLGKVEEIAATAVLLASDGGNFYCGQILSPNGGAVFF